MEEGRGRSEMRWDGWMNPMGKDFEHCAEGAGESLQAVGAMHRCLEQEQLDLCGVEADFGDCVGAA